MKYAIFLFIFCSLAISPVSFAQDSDHVRISVEKFEELLQAAQAEPTPTPQIEPLPPIDYSLTEGTYTVTVSEKYAAIQCTVQLNILSKEWIKIPLVTTDTALSEVRLDGKLSTLRGENHRYWLHVKEPGQHRLDLTYSAAVERLIGGYRLEFSTPLTASGTLKTIIPGHWLATHVLPSEGITVTQSDGSTQIDAVLVSSDRVQILWGEQKPNGYSYTSGLYTVHVEEKGVFVKASYRLEIDSDQPVQIPVVFQDYGLLGITVAKKALAIIKVGNMFGVQLQGHGTYSLEAEFAANVNRTDGQPSLNLKIPLSPITRFTFSVPGKRTVSVSPLVPMKEDADDKVTVVTVHFPQTDEVKFIWSDSRPVPEQMVRMNSEGYYAVLAEEGVLRINATFLFDIISGKTHELGLSLPDGVVVYQVVGEGITDWRTFSREQDKKRYLQAYFDLPRHGQYQLSITYDQLISKTNKKQDPIAVPLIQPEPVHRYQGTVLLLSGETLEFVPQNVEGYIPVGAEVIPAQIKSKLKEKVAHGYKYVGKALPLLVTLEVPQKDEAKFDSTINTLYTIEEGILKARSSVDLMVKSGVLKEVVFVFPKETTVLDLISPSLLKFVEATKNNSKWVTVQFTQAMEGSFRVDIAFETLVDTKLTSLQLNPIRTRVAEVERGFIGVETVATVEVVTEKADEIQEIETKELPIWLTERTNRPILLAYKYSYLPYNLVLRITRHESVPTLEARILSAESRTDFHKDGNTLTETTYTIVNYTKQFLRIDMPATVRLWSAQVGDDIVKMAKDKDDQYILPLPRSKEPLICRIKYSQKEKEMGNWGSIRVHIPKTDLFTSQLTWSLNLPTEFQYFLTTANMDVSLHRNNIFTLSKQLSAADDDIFYFSTNYRLKKLRFGLSAGTIVLTILLLVLWTRRQKAQHLIEKIVTGGLLLLFGAAIIFLKLDLGLIVITIAIAMTISYLVSLRKKVSEVE